MRKVCFVTGSRAEYGLLKGVMRKVRDGENTELQIVATNMHLMPEFGNTYLEIERDGFVIDEKVRMKRRNDSVDAVTESMAEELLGMTSVLKRLKPDVVVILGDRYEMLIVAIVAMMNNIPIAHIHGGEITEGAFDDAIRHSITKMSRLHFTSTEEYRMRVIQMGEVPDNVFYVGALGVENIYKMEAVSKDELEEFLNLRFDKPTLLVTYHPETLSQQSIKGGISLLKALDEMRDIQVVFTMPNSDPGADMMKNAMVEFTDRNKERTRIFDSLGVRRYLSLLRYVTAVAGNSSSGVIEVPSFGIPTLNIGNRQKGRVMSKSVLNCGVELEDVRNGLNRVLNDVVFRMEAQTAVNPYDKAGTAESIFRVLETADLGGYKKFYDIRFDI